VGRHAKGQLALAVHLSHLDLLGETNKDRDGNGGNGRCIRERRHKLHARDALLRPCDGTSPDRSPNEELGALASMKFGQKLVDLGVLRQVQPFQGQEVTQGGEVVILVHKL
jgi:hypothetical protein